MKTTELSDQAMDTLLRAPVEVADKDFSVRLLRQLRARQALRMRRGTGALWPAGLLALAVAAAGIPSERLPGWLGVVRVQSRELFTQLPQVPVWQGFVDAASDPSLWLPVILALTLLFLLLPLAEE